MVADLDALPRSVRLAFFALLALILAVFAFVFVKGFSPSEGASKPSGSARHSPRTSFMPSRTDSVRPSSVMWSPAWMT